VLVEKKKKIYSAFLAFEKRVVTIFKGKNIDWY
jgi:hypothetical protein